MRSSHTSGGSASSLAISAAGYASGDLRMGAAARGAGAGLAAGPMLRSATGPEPGIAAGGAEDPLTAGAAFDGSSASRTVVAAPLDPGAFTGEASSVLDRR
jgi:hypothetical protein